MSHGQGSTIACRQGRCHYRRRPGNRASHCRRADRAGRPGGHRRHRRPLAEQPRRSSAAAPSGSRWTSPTATSFDAFLTEVENRLGPLDVLVNNAGIMPIGPFVDETDATAKRHGGHQPPRRHLWLQAGSRAVHARAAAATWSTSPRRRVRPVFRRRHLLRDEARRRRPQRGDPRRDAPRRDIDVSIVMPLSSTPNSVRPAASARESRPRARRRGQRDRRGAAERPRPRLRARQLDALTGSRRSCRAACRGRSATRSRVTRCSSTPTTCPAGLREAHRRPSPSTEAPAGACPVGRRAGRGAEPEKESVPSRSQSAISAPI